MNHRTPKGLAAAVTTVAISALPSAALAQPTGSAEATAVEVEGVLVISDSEADEGRASSTGVEVLGQRISGTEQEGEGSSESSVLDSRDLGISEDDAHIQVGYASSTVNGDGSSESSSDFLVVDVGDGLIRIEVLSSDASSDDGAESDGVRITSTEDPSGEGIRILHARADAESGESGVAYVGGNGILTNEQTGGLCATELVIVGADLICVAATEGGGTAASVVGDATVAGTRIGTVVGVEADPAGSREVASEDPAEEEAPAPAPVEPAPASDELPRTGGGAAALVLMGGSALAAGDRLRRWR